MSCNCNFWGFSNDGCKNNLVMDKVCIESQRSLIAGVDEQIYFSNDIISATGYFKLLTQPAETPEGATVTLQFLLNNVPVNIIAGIDPLSANEAVAFTVTGFNEIRIVSNATGTISYELSLTPRYAI